MKITFYTVYALIGAVVAQEGCTAGGDRIGIDQACLGRCHIFNSGDFGACNNYQFTEADVSGQCGDSPANPCKAAFNAIWDAEQANCGNCYFVEMAYADGTKRSTYIQAVDIHETDVKFGIGQQGWKNLCPYVCAGTGECGYTPEYCAYGTIPDTPAWGGNISCAVEHAGISFKRVECVAPTEKPLVSAPIGIIPPEVTDPAVATNPAVSSTPSPIRPTPGTGITAPVLVLPRAAEVNAIVNNAAPLVTAPILVLPPNGGSTPKPVLPVGAVEECKRKVGSINVTWNEECQVLCEFYHSQPVHCPQGSTGEGLVDCVSAKHPYCTL